MQWFQVFVLAVIEGITEFLPVSSTGHLILTSKLLQIPDTEFLKSFEIIIQLGAILAIVVMYFKRVWSNKRWWGKIAASFVVTGILGAIFYKFVKNYLLASDLVVVVSLILGGIVLLFLEGWMKKRKEGLEIGEIKLSHSIVIGLAQALAMIPGVSRSAATIIGGLGVGMSRSAAVEFSFLLAVPTMMAASLMDLLSVGGGFSMTEYQMLGVGMIGAFVSAWIVVKAFLRYVENNSFSVFGWYRIVVGILYLMVMR